MSQTHFGFETVDERDKARRVRGVFDSVAPRYDLMNDLMSMGLHRAWKAYTVLVADVQPGHHVLDIAGGSGDLARVIGQALGSCQPVAEQHGVRLARTGPTAGPALLMDAVRLQQLLQNLVENAVQHSPAGGQVLVAVEARPESGEALVTVSDEGPGFRAEDLPRVFEPFFTRRQGGTGLGLAIAQRIVAEHGGRLTAANGPVGGAHLTVTLPLLPG